MPLPVTVLNDLEIKNLEITENYALQVLYWDKVSGKLYAALANYSVGDATSELKGVIKLAGDLGGTAEAPTVPRLDDMYTKDEVNAMLSSVYITKSSVQDLSALNALTNQEVGWVRNVRDSGINYLYVGVSTEFPTGWDALGAVIDITVKEDKANKTGDIVANKTSVEKYPHVKAVFDMVDPKIEAVVESPVKIRKVWRGTQAEFKALLNGGLVIDNVDYAYIKVTNVVREPLTPVSYVLTEFDNDTNQMMYADCSLVIPSLVTDFCCRIIVMQGITVTVFGGLSLTSTVGTPSTGDKVLSRGTYMLIQKGGTSNFVLC